MTDITNLTQQEIDANKSFFTNCKHCEAKFNPFPGDDSEECDGCFIIRMQEEIGQLELHVTRGYYTGTWSCTLKDWDLGVAFGDGNTIQEAIEAFLEEVAGKKNIDAKYLQHQYTWS